MPPELGYILANSANINEKIIANTPTIIQTHIDAAPAMSAAIAGITIIPDPIIAPAAKNMRWERDNCFFNSAMIVLGSSLLLKLRWRAII